MNSLLSGILAIIIALTSMCGGVANVGKTVDIDLSASIDGDPSALLSSFIPDPSIAEKLPALVAEISKALQAASISFTADQTTGRMAANINGAALTSVTVKANEAGDGWQVISPLFPSTLLTVKQETLDQMRSSMTQGAGSFSIDDLKEKLQGIDFASIAQTASAAVSEAVSALMGSAGEPETGSFVINDVEYTVKIPYNITAKQAEILTLTALKNILSDEAVSGLMSQFVPSFSVSGLDETLEQLNAKDESEFPPLEIASYANEAGESCMQGIYGEGDAAMKASYSNAQKGTALLLDLGMAKISFTTDKETNKYAFDVTASMNGKSYALTGSLSIPAAGSVSLNLSVSGLAMPVTLDLTMTKGENRYDVDGKIFIAILPVYVKGFIATVEDRSDFQLALSVPSSAEEVFTLTLKGAMTYPEAPAFAADGLKEVAYEALAQDQQTASAFAAEVGQTTQTLIDSLRETFKGLFDAIENLKAQPVVVEETETVEEAPAEDPAA